MRKIVVQSAVLLALFLLVAFGVFVVNQTAQVVDLASRIDPVAGDVTLYGLLAVYGLCLAVPAYLLLRLPAPLKPPDSEDSPEFPQHVERLAARMRRNALLKRQKISTREDVESAMLILDAHADQAIKTAASEVFLTTAISQNGSLDGALVLAAQSKLVLQVARIYYQRPTLRDLSFLYANVASTTFVTVELDDIDLSAQIEPLLGNFMGSLAGAIPGLQAASALVVNSVTSGAANAFLTLRVGLITKQYCRSLVVPERSVIRRSALRQATGMLGGIVAAGALRISGAAGKVAVKRMGKVGRGVRNAARGVGNQLKGAGDAIKERMRSEKPALPSPSVGSGPPAIVFQQQADAAASSSAGLNPGSPQVNAVRDTAVRVGHQLKRAGGSIKTAGTSLVNRVRAQRSVKPGEAVVEATAVLTDGTEVPNLYLHAPEPPPAPAGAPAQEPQAGPGSGDPAVRPRLP